MGVLSVLWNGECIWVLHASLTSNWRFCILKEFRGWVCALSSSAAAPPMRHTLFQISMLEEKYALPEVRNAMMQSFSLQKVVEVLIQHSHNFWNEAIMKKAKGFLFYLEATIVQSYLSLPSAF